jgi:polyhydroxyalkanoate synthase
MRQNWPQPLWLHLGSAWSCLSSSVNGWMMSQNGLIPSQNPNQPQNPPPSLKNAPDPLSVSRYIARDAATQWQAFLQGLYCYQQTVLPPQQASWKIIAQHQSAALKFLPSAKKTKNPPAIVLIPSLINRFHILDLKSEQSFARYLQKQGYHIYLLDWHHDLNKPLPASLDACITDYILPLLQKIPEKSWHLLGYCMGGTLSIAVAALHPKPIKSLTLVATPWDFHQPDTTVGQNIMRYLSEIKQQSPQQALFKSDWLQMLFWRHDPLTALHKFQRFANLIPGSAEAEIFILAEDWLNDGIDLPLSLLDECAHMWYGANQTAKNRWTIAGQKIALKNLDKLPIHLVTADRDRLVPVAGSLAIARQHKKTTITTCDTGHIGLFAGTKSLKLIWPQLQQFLSHHNTR